MFRVLFQDSKTELVDSGGEIITGLVLQDIVEVPLSYSAVTLLQSK